MLRQRSLGPFVEKEGGADDQLFGGNKVTPSLNAELNLSTARALIDYKFSLTYGSNDRFFFSDEAFRHCIPGNPKTDNWIELGSGHREAEIVILANAKHDAPEPHQPAARIIVDCLSSYSIYQFHDTSDGSRLKGSWDSSDTNTLRSHGGNLAPILLWLQENDIKRYELICKQIGRILPVFDRFALEEKFGKVSLRWKNKYLPDKPMGAHLTSDGSLRLFALVTLLNLPDDMLPGIILLDEPELGLHPSGISLIGHMIRSLSRTKQVIIATQSPLLVDTFNIDEIIVAECAGTKSVLTPKHADDYKEWLDDSFKAGELWLKNVLGGRP
jgi:hypothetical protein